jgi:TP901 family phage tail tape measure protein
MAQLKIDLVVDDKGSIVVKQFGGNVAKSLDTAGGSFDGFGRRVGLAGAALTGFVGVVGGIVSLIGGRGLQVFSDLEAKLIGVQKTTDFTAAEMEVFGNSITAMGRRLPVATGSLLEIAGVAGQLGIKGVDNITSFTEVMGKLSLATDVAGAEGAADIARLLNVTGEGVATIETFGAVLVGLGNNSAATESEILGMATQIGQATAAFSVGSTEALAMGAAMKSVGVQAELGGSVVGRSMRAIEASIVAGGEQLTRLSQVTGIAEKDLKRAFGDNATLVFQKFLQGIGSMIEGGKTAAESLDLFGLKGDEVLKVLPTMAVNTKVFDNALRLANEEVKKGTALNNEAAKAGEGLGAQMLLVSNITTEMSKSIGEELAPHAKDLVGVFGDWWEANDELISQDISGFIGGIAGASKVAYETTKGLTTGIVDLNNESQSFIDTAFGIAGPDALDWGIIGAVLFKGGFGAAGIAGALVTINNQLELLGKNSVLRLPDMSLGSLPGKLRASSEAFSLAFEGLYGKRDSSTGELLSEIEQIDRKIKSLQDSKEPWQIFPDPSETKRRATEVKTELEALEQQRARLVKASREKSLLFVDPWQVNAGAAAGSTGSAAPGNLPAARKVTIPVTGGSTTTGGNTGGLLAEYDKLDAAMKRYYADLDALAKKEGQRAADITAAATATTQHILALNGRENAKGVAMDSWQKNFELREEYQKESLKKMGDNEASFVEQAKSATTGWASGFSSSLNDMLWDADATFGDILTSFGKMISQMIIQQGVTKALEWGFSLIPSAQGNVFSGPGISSYSNQVVTRPTIFPFAHGVGLMGEKTGSPGEAIMPLTRMSGGDLGVKASGGSGGGATLVVNNHITIDKGAGGSESDRESLANQIAGAIKQQVKEIIGQETRYGGILYQGAR